MANKDQKTEQPTLRRMQKAREEGSFPSARIFVSALQFLAFVAMLRSWGPTWVTATHETMASLLHHALAPRLDPAFIVNLSLDLVRRPFMPLAILGGVLMGVTLAAQLMVTRLRVSLQKLAPDPKRLNPLAKLRELPRQNLPALLQAAIMLPVFGWAVYWLVRDDFEGFLSLSLENVSVGGGPHR